MSPVKIKATPSISSGLKHTELFKYVLGGPLDFFGGIVRL